MLDGILGRGFSSKCKSLIKPTRTRINVVRNRKEATQRFLKGNLAQLLANGLDIDAYGRVKQTEEFIAGQNLLSCYDFIEQSFEYLLKQLSVMQKLRECPTECREAVGSLMFAAARFSDLPELRDLRDTFQERYGSSLEHFVNQEFVEKLTLKAPPMEKKLKLLQGIALESSIKWDSRGFEQRMANPSTFARDQPKKYESIHVHDDKYKPCNGKETVRQTDKGNHKELIDNRHRVCNDNDENVLKRDELDCQFFVRKELRGDGHKQLMGREQTISNRDNYDIPFQGRKEFTGDKHESLNGKEDTALKTVRPGRSYRGRRPEVVDSDGKDISSTVTSAFGKSNTANSASKVQKEETDGLKSYSSYALPPPYIKPKDKILPPPYIKSKDSKYGVNAEAKHANSDNDGTSMDKPSRHKRDNDVRRSERIQGDSDHPTCENQVSGPAQVSIHGPRGHEKDAPYRDGIPLPKTRSNRRKHSKSPSSHEDLGNHENDGVVKRSSSSRRRDKSRRGSQILIDDEHHRKDEEEIRMDKLLLHYSKKPSTYDPEKIRRKSKAHALHQIDADTVETLQYFSRDGHDVQAAMVPPPSRSISLPRAQSASTETVKVYARANSFQPDKPAQHVHPKLPEYDDLAARFAALRGGGER